MTENTPKPSEAAIREASRRVGASYDFTTPAIKALAAMIEKYEPETLVDPDLVRAREIYSDLFSDSDTKNSILAGNCDKGSIQVILRAIKETRAEYEK